MSPRVSGYRNSHRQCFKLACLADLSTAARRFVEKQREIARESLRGSAPSVCLSPAGTTQKDATPLLRCIAAETVRSLVKAGNYAARRRHKFARISILRSARGLLACNNFNLLYIHGFDFGLWPKLSVIHMRCSRTGSSRSEVSSS